MHTLESSRHPWRGVVCLAAIVFVCLSAALVLAAPAQAKTFYGSKPPAKSWICRTFNVCYTGTWCTQGDPNTAYNLTSPAWRCYTVRY